jgi:hypothetical protein
MTKETEKKLPATLNTAATNILKATQTSSLAPMLKFKKGKYFIGEEEVPLGRRFLAYCEDWRVGYIKFHESEVVDQRIGKVADGFVVPERDTLGDTDPDEWGKGNDGRPLDPWVRQSYLPIEDVET